MHLTLCFAFQVNLRPSYQREYVWTTRTASRLVESLLLNVPIPTMFFHETEAPDPSPACCTPAACSAAALTRSNLTGGEHGGGGRQAAADLHLGLHDGFDPVSALSVIVCCTHGREANPPSPQANFPMARLSSSMGLKCTRT